MQQQHHQNDYSSVPVAAKKRTNFAKYCIVTFNASSATAAIKKENVSLDDCVSKR